MGAAILGALGSIATSVTYEFWYAAADAGEVSATPLIIAAGASVALNGAALAFLVLPALHQSPTAVTILVAALVVVFGGILALAVVFPIMSTVLIAIAAMVTVVLMRRSERRRVFTAGRGLARS